MHPRLTVDLDDPEFNKRRFSVSQAYYQSKLAQVMYTYWLADRLKNTHVTANCIRVTNVKVDLSRYPGLGRIAKAAYKAKSRKAISPEQMAQTYVHIATSEDLGNVTGQYFDHHGERVSSGRYSEDSRHIDAVMALTMKYIQK